MLILNKIELSYNLIIVLLTFISYSIIGFIDDIKIINKLNRIGINYYRTLVVASFVNKNVTSDQRIRLFKSNFSQ